MFVVPRFCGALLSEADGGSDSSPAATMNRRGGQASIMSVLRDTVRTHFVPPYSTLPPKTLVRSPPREMDEKETDLAREVLGLL